MLTPHASRVLGYCRKILVVGAAGLLASSASAAKLGHPQYSAAGATPAQKQWNLICDPTGAVSGSTSTQYQPNIAGLDTITAWSGFQINEVDVAVTDGETIWVDQFPNLPVGTTSFVIVPPDDEELAAAVSTGGTTYYASLDGSEVGAVQVFWAPYGSTPTPPIISEVTTAAVVGPQKPTISFPSFQSDVNTHVITFDSLTTDPRQVATFTNYANGSGSFPDYFDTDDSYSGPGFTYTAGQISPQTTRLFLQPPPPVCQKPPVCPKPILVCPKKGIDRDKH